MNNRRKTPLHLDKRGGDEIVRNRSQKSQQNICIQFQTGGSLAGSKGANSVCPGRKTDRDPESRSGGEVGMKRAL
jgi:hypothetical protein